MKLYKCEVCGKISEKYYGDINFSIFSGLKDYDLCKTHKEIFTKMIENYEKKQKRLENEFIQEVKNWVKRGK